MRHEILKKLTLKDYSLTHFESERKNCVPYMICSWRKTNCSTPNVNICVNLGMSKSKCLNKHYSRLLCQLENTGNHLCYAWSYRFYKVTKHFLRSVWNLGGFYHFYCLEWPVSQTFKQGYYLYISQILKTIFWSYLHPKL